jgi:hypothetical protein
MLFLLSFNQTLIQFLNGRKVFLQALFIFSPSFCGVYFQLVLALGIDEQSHQMQLIWGIKKSFPLSPKVQFLCTLWCLSYVMRKQILPEMTLVLSAESPFF